MDALLLLYLATFGGGGRDFPQAIAVDGTGRAIVAGTSASDNLPTSADVAQKKPMTKAWTPFLAFLDAEGKQSSYATYLGGTAHGYGGAVAVGRDGSTCLAGTTSAPDFPVTAGAAQTKFGGTGGRRGAGDAYVAKFDSAGKLVFASYFGATSDEGAAAVAISDAGECIAAGFTTSGNLPTTHKAAHEKRPAGLLSGFLVVFTADGKQISYATYLPHDVSAMRMVGGVCFVAGQGRVSKIGLKGKREEWSTVVANGQGDWTRAMAFEGDHIVIASESKDGGKGSLVRVRAKDGHVMAKISHEGSVHALESAGPGKVWIAGTAGLPSKAFVALLDAEGKQLLRRDGTEKQVVVRALSLGPDGSLFAAGEEAEDVFVWKLRVNTANGHTAIQKQTMTLATLQR